MPGVRGPRWSEIPFSYTKPCYNIPFFIFAGVPSVCLLFLSQIFERILCPAPGHAAVSDRSEG